MDNKKVKNILNELYALDPELAKYEKEIKKIIEEYLKAKPDSKFDEKFALELREKVMARAKELKTKESDKRQMSNGLAIFFKVSYATVGIALLLLLVISLPAIYSKNKTGPKTALNLSGGITKIGNSAFGHLALNTNQTKTESDMALRAGSTASAPVAATQTYQANQSDEKSASSVADISAVGVKRTSMPYPIDIERINYEYVYKGGDFDAMPDSLAVYKKAKSDIASRELGKYLTEFKIDTLNLNKFGGANLDNLTMSENQEFGYTLSINFQEATIDINSNWQQWPHPENNCRDEKCYAQYRLTKDDVPADEKIIDIANQFINDYGIDVSHYGQPYIQKNWQKFYGIAADNAEIYVPEEITVIYPLVLDGKTLHDESGYPNGLYVTVNIRRNRVAGARPITPYNYISSDYEMITDKDKIVEYAKKGGIYPAYQYPDPTKTIEIGLDTPTLGLVRHWNYNQETGQSEELFAPALIFPIIKNETEAANYYNDYIIVPLAKEIFEKQDNNVVGVPVPLLERGQSGMSGVSTGAAGAVK